MTTAPPLHGERTVDTPNGGEMLTITHLPPPSHQHATCAWCYERFRTIVDLLDHVDDAHLDPQDDATGRTIEAA